MISLVLAVIALVLAILSLTPVNRAPFLTISVILLALAEILDGSTVY